MRARLGVWLCILIGGAVASAQAPPVAAPAFEVASVKRNVSGDVRASIQVPPAGALRYINVPLRVLIRDAYQVDPYAERYTLVSGQYARIIGSSAGGPQPDVPRFDILAKPPDNTPPRERRAMMRTLLEDRFKLRVHREMRSMRVYALTVARPGRLGPNLAPSTFDCDAYLARRRAGGKAEQPVDAKGDSWCLSPIDHRTPGVDQRRSAGSLKLLRNGLMPWVDRPIVDATGLSGNFEWVLTFASGPDAPSDVPRIFDAVQEQLGLRLEARQAPVEVLVIDAVELPIPD